MLRAIDPLKVVADHNLCGPLNKLMKPVQYADEVSPQGARTLRFSMHRSFLEGFSFNKDTHFDAWVRAPLHFSISRETLTATVEVPELIPGVNFFPSKKHPRYCITVVLAAVPDLYPKETANGATYAPSHANYRDMPYDVSTEWLSIDQSTPATSLQVKLADAPPADDYALVLSIGVRIGAPDETGSFAPVKYEGCGKILAAG